MTEPDYRLEMLTLGPAELQRTSALLRLVFPHAPHLTPAHLRWQYVENPDGTALGCNAYRGDEVIGHAAAVPLRAKLGGTLLPGLFLLNTAVRPEHRRRNVTRRITDTIFAEAVRLGYAFCVSTGNHRSTIPLLTRFKMVAPLDARIGFGSPRRRVVDQVPSFERQWSADAMSWRLANPERAYAVHRRDDQAIVVAPTGRAGVGAILYAGPDRGGVARTTAAATGPARVWLGLDPRLDWRRSAYVRIPARLRPSPLNLVFKDLSGGALHPDPARVVFHGLDFDPF